MLPEKLLDVSYRDVFSAVHFQMSTATTTDHEATGHIPATIFVQTLALRGLEESL
jgi:hypothetical protein